MAWIEIIKGDKMSTNNNERIDQLIQHEHALIALIRSRHEKELEPYYKRLRELSDIRYPTYLISTQQAEQWNHFNAQQVQAKSAGQALAQGAQNFGNDFTNRPVVKGLDY
jgi:hypothetical protein